MKRKTTKKPAKKAALTPRNPVARTLKESGLFRPKIVPAAKDATYRRRSKHPKPLVQADDGE